MSISLEVTREGVRGELALLIAPGTVAATRDRLVEDQITDALFAAARQLGAVLAADPHAYAHPLDGRDEEGRTRFLIQARLEGDRLLPVGRGRRKGRRGAT